MTFYWGGFMDTQNNIAFDYLQTLPSNVVGSIILIFIVLTAMLVLTRKGPFHVIARILKFFTKFIGIILKQFVRLLRLLRLVSKAKVTRISAKGTSKLGPSVAVAFARTVAEETETDITLKTNFETTISDLEDLIITNKEDLLIGYTDIDQGIKDRLNKFDIESSKEFVVQFLSNEFESKMSLIDDVKLPELLQDELKSDEDIDHHFLLLQLIILQKSLDKLSVRKRYELELLQKLGADNRKAYIELDSKAVQDLIEAKSRIKTLDGLVFTKLDLKDVKDDKAYADEERTNQQGVIDNANRQTADNDLVKAKYFFKYDVPVRHKINPQNLFEDVQASNIIELFRFSDRKHYFVLSEMRKLINANIMKLAVMLSTIVYLVFVANIFFSDSIGFSYIIPDLKAAVPVIEKNNGPEKPAVKPVILKKQEPKKAPVEVKKEILKEEKPREVEPKQVIKPEVKQDVDVKTDTPELVKKPEDVKEVKQPEETVTEQEIKTEAQETGVQTEVKEEAVKLPSEEVIKENGSEENSTQPIQKEAESEKETETQPKETEPQKDSSIKGNLPKIYAFVTPETQYISKDVKCVSGKANCADGELETFVTFQVPFLNWSFQLVDYPIEFRARSIDQAIFGILSCLFGIFVMWLFYQKEYKVYQEYNGTQLDNFMQKSLNRISVNYRVIVANTVQSVQRADTVEAMTDYSSKWSILLPWMAFRAFYLEFFLRNVMYQILRNSSYYLLFIPMIFFVVILITALVFNIGIGILFDQNIFFYLFFIALIYLYYRYLQESVSFILDEIKEDTWQEFHNLNMQNDIKRYTAAWAQNLKQWRDLHKNE